MKKFLLILLATHWCVAARAEAVTLDIADADAFSNWTVIDANNDGTLWKYSSKNALYHSGNKADDWLVSPGIELKAGVLYDVAAVLRVDTSTPRFSFHDFAVYAGNAPTVDAQTTEIVKQVGAEYSLDPKTYSGTFTPEADGTYYFSVHCTSGSWTDDLYFHRFVIESNENGGADDVVTVELPYSEDFSGNHGYTFFHVNSESRDWDISNYRLRYYGKNFYTSDAYAVTPAFRFEKGVSYRLQFKTWISSASSSNYKPLSVKLGQGKTADQLTTELFAETIQTSSQSEKTVNFNVEEDGVYYLAFYCGGDVNANDIFVDDVKLQAMLTSPLAVTDLVVTPAEKGAMEATVSWINPTSTNTGETLESISKAEIRRNGTVVGTVDEGLIVGERASFKDSTIDGAGKYQYSVIVYFNENPSEASTVTSSWIGKDTSVGNVQNVVATKVDDHTVSLNFDIPTGSNGGYIDPADITYKITRQAGTASAVTLVEAYNGELPYIDSDINGLNSYVYSVYTNYNGSTSWAPSKSNAVILGGAVDIPYSQDFSTSNHFFTFFHGENATRDWSVSSSRLQYWGNPADAYAVTPGINLEAGKAYELTFTTRLSTATSGSEKPLYVRMGQQPTIAGLDTQLFYEVIESTFSSTKTVKVSVPADGVYYIAFHCLGTVNSNDIYVDDITLKEIPVAPLAVTDFTAEAAELGQLKAILKWTNPTDDNTGGKITKITKAVLSRGNTELSTVEEGLVPGEEFTYTDETIETAGKYNYSVILYLGTNASPAVTASTEWVGPDTPKPLENAVASLNEDGVTMTISWDAVSPVGVNGGYVDTSAITYNVIRKPDNKEVAADTAETSVTDNVESVSLGMYNYQISMVQYPTVAAAETEKIRLGDAIEVTEENPYRPDFSNAETFDIWTLTPGETGTGLWKYESKNQTLETGFIYNEPWALTPPLKMLAGKYKVVYKATCYSARYTSDIEIYLTDAPTHEAELKTLIHSKKVESVSYPDAIEVEFEVPADGVYHIGYVDVTDDHWKLALSQADVEVVELAPRPVASLPVTDFTAVAAPQGAMEVTLTWTNPSKDVDDNDLQAITSVVISRGDDVIATISEDLVPGEEFTYTDKGVETAGIHNYSAVVYVEDLLSESASATSDWVGLDTPLPIENATAVCDETETTVTISWDEVGEKGVHEGYVDRSAITYDVIRMPDNVEVATGVSATSATDNVSELELGKYWYEVSINGYTDIPAVETAAIVLGKAIEINEDSKLYNPDFADSATFDVWKFIANEDGNGWIYDDESQALLAESAAGAWTYSAPLDATTGIYNLSFTAYRADGDDLDDEQIEIYLMPKGAVHSEGMTPLYVGSVSATSSDATVTNVEIKVPENGVYHLAYLCATPSEAHNKLYLSGTSLEYLHDGSNGEDCVGSLNGYDASITYDAASREVRATGGVLYVFRTDGSLVGKSNEGVFRMDGYEDGIYIARCADAVVKFKK